MDFLKIAKQDNVIVALKDFSKGDTIHLDNDTITLQEPIVSGHKIAISPIQTGDAVIKYGAPIGIAQSDISKGAHVHTHNLKTGLDGLLNYEYQPSLNELTPQEKGYFKGFRRPDGKVGIRNEVWIIPTVGCVNTNAQKMAQDAQAFLGGSIDGIYAFPHPYGCSQLSDDLENTKRALAGLINHPNAAAVLVLGLGCENNDVKDMQEILGTWDDKRVKFLVCQDVDDEYQAAHKLLAELSDYAKSFTREDVPMGELIVGLKCGGSDGFSGITANPLVGAFTDRLIAEGGTALLTEVPEMFGAETLLMNRCETPELFEQTVSLINDFKQYFIDNNQEIYENPSPGNKDGGISTLEDKSLGCTQKGGTANVTAVLGYAEPAKTKGLNLLSGPGNDLVSISNMTASGAHIILFTTGRGTPFGTAAPTVKISSNTALATKKSGWVDFNAGVLLDGVPMDELCDKLYAYIRALASGEIKTKSEETGAREFTIFKTGVTL